MKNKLYLYTVGSAILLLIASKGYAWDPRFDYTMAIDVITCNSVTSLCEWQTYSSKDQFEFEKVAYSCDNLEIFAKTIEQTIVLDEGMNSLYQFKFSTYATRYKNNGDVVYNLESEFIEPASSTRTTSFKLGDPDIQISGEGHYYDFDNNAVVLNRGKEVWHWINYRFIYSSTNALIPPLERFSLPEFMGYMIFGPQIMNSQSAPIVESQPLKGDRLFAVQQYVKQQRVSNIDPKKAYYSIRQDMCSCDILTKHCESLSKDIISKSFEFMPGNPPGRNESIEGYIADISHSSTLPVSGKKIDYHFYPYMMLDSDDNPTGYVSYSLMSYESGTNEFFNNGKIRHKLNQGNVNEFVFQDGDRIYRAYFLYGPHNVPRLAFPEPPEVIGDTIFPLPCSSGLVH